MNIKGMDKNMCCRGFQFEIGKEYKIEINKPLKESDLCSDKVFHYCKSLANVHYHYDCHFDNRFFEIEVLGEEIGDGNKYGSNHIKVIREIVGEELDILKGKVNHNTGLFNSGYHNSGDNNSGYRNSGDNNSGDHNSGYHNSGDHNSGYRNSGDYNSGDHNSGIRNSGDHNSGDRNSGDYNSGYRNSGYKNSGDNNSGSFNSGSFNSGIANKCNYSNGIFCNRDDSNIRIFNKPSGMSFEDFAVRDYFRALMSVNFKLTEWICYTKEEVESDPKKREVGGYLKIYTMNEAWANWWNEMTPENKEIIKSIPNFDPEIFKDITGIEV